MKAWRRLVPMLLAKKKGRQTYKNKNKNKNKNAQPKVLSENENTSEFVSMECVVFDRCFSVLELTWRGSVAVRQCCYLVTPLETSCCLRLSAGRSSWRQCLGKLPLATAMIVFQLFVLSVRPPPTSIVSKLTFYVLVCVSHCPNCTASCLQAHQHRPIAV